MYVLCVCMCSLCVLCVCMCSLYVFCIRMFCLCVCSLHVHVRVLCVHVLSVCPLYVHVFCLCLCVCACVLSVSMYVCEYVLCGCMCSVCVCVRGEVIFSVYISRNRADAPASAILSLVTMGGGKAKIPPAKVKLAQPSCLSLSKPRRDSKRARRLVSHHCHPTPFLPRFAFKGRMII